MNAEQLVRENWNLVHYVIRRFFPYHGKEWGDLVGAGAIGLVKAAKYYDPSKGAFSSLAVSLIRNEVQNYIRKHWKHWNRWGMSLDDHLVDDEEDTIHNLIPDVSASFEEEAEQRVMVEKLLSKLSKKDRDMIQRYYGIGTTPQTYVQIAEAHGCSKSWVQMRIKDALKRLQREVARDGAA